MAAKSQGRGVSGGLPSRHLRWLRFLYQFSLRSLLIATTLVAVGCWWYLRPERRDEPLGAGELRLLRQVRTVPLNEAEQRAVVGQTDVVAKTVEDGSWRVVDLHGDAWVVGTMAADRRQGWWTTYHGSGQKAAEGKVDRGARRGLWKTWYADGTRASEATYIPGRLQPDPSGWALRIVRTSLRHGEARAWHPSGKIKLEGQYENDARAGEWAYYDEQGDLLERGTYRKDRRDGFWLVRETESGALRAVRYIHGRTEQQHAALLANLRDDFDSSDVRRQLNAARQLQELGETGVPLLEQGLRSEDDAKRRLALRGLVQSRSISDEALPLVEQLADHPEPGIALRAMLLAAMHCDGEGKTDRRLLDRLGDAVGECRQQLLRVELLQPLCRLDERRRPELFAQLAQAVVSPLQPQPDDTRPIWATEEDLLYFKIQQLDVSSLVELEAEYPALLNRAFASPDPLVRATVLRALDELVKREPPDREDSSITLRWTIPPEYEGLVEQGKADGHELVRDQAGGVGVESHGGSFGCGIGAGIF